MKNDRRNKNALLILAGAIAGAAASHYLHTENGKKMIKDISDRSADLKDDLVNRVSTISDQVKDKAKSIVNTTENEVSNIQDMTLNKVENLKNQLDEIASSIENLSDLEAGNFQKGINKAKRKLQYSDS